MRESKESDYLSAVEELIRGKKVDAHSNKPSTLFSCRHEPVGSLVAAPRFAGKEKKLYFRKIVAKTKILRNEKI